MLVYKIIDKPTIMSDTTTLEIHTDALRVYKNNEQFQIPYYNIKRISILTNNQKHYLHIVYSGSDKSKEYVFTIGNVLSPQIIIETLHKNIRKEIEMFSAIKIEYYQ